MKSILTFFLGLILFISPAYAIKHGDDVEDKPKRPVVQVIYPSGDGKYYVPVIVYDGTVDDDNVQKFTEELDQFVKQGPDAVVIELTTYGGEVDGGWRMARAIERSGVKTVCVVENEVASMGVFILESCTTRVLVRRSFITAHYPYFPYVTNNSEQTFKNYIARQRGLNEEMLVQLSRRSKLSKAEVKQKLDAGDWVMLPEEALKAGEIDVIADSVEQVQKSLESKGNLDLKNHKK
jgi:membrane-bound ClpP family serine protease